MKRSTKDVLYFYIGRENEPTLRVEQGEVFEVETQMNAGPWLDDHPQGEELRKKIISGNPSSGCIYINGAAPGDMLIVDVLDIELGQLGYTNFKGSTGAMPAWFGSSAIGAHSKVVKIQNEMIFWDENLRIPVQPMVGYVGVAPESERYHHGWGGFWGGNFDVQEITTGAKVYLPVFVPGALLHVGDMHAIQGDGEICGAGGIESEGIVKMSCTVAPKPASMTMPRIENETHIIAVGIAKPAEEAFRQALESLVLWIEEDYRIPRGEAFLLLGQVLEARCTQFVNPSFTYVAKIAKKYLRKR